jgi:orotidine-5'-phosphate decarboxylase
VTTFGARLRDALDTRGPLCAGIDPHPKLMASWGLADDPAALEWFALRAVEAFAGEVAVVKPQSAFYERHGSAGIAVLERVVREAKAGGALVLLDVKRGDIGSTARAYADAYLDPSSPLAADAMTASPYLGFGSLEPLFAAADTHGGGVFVLTLTSNPEGSEVQRAVSADGSRTVAGGILAGIAALNAGAVPMGSIGAVVGATIGDTSEEFAIDGPLLVPGIGAQGGTPDDVRRIFAACLPNVLVASSRALLTAGPDLSSLRAAAARTNEALLAAFR